MRMKIQGSSIITLLACAGAVLMVLSIAAPRAGHAQPATDSRSIEIQNAQDALRFLYSRDQFEEVVLQAEALLETDDGNATAYLMKDRAERRIALRNAPEADTGSSIIPRPPTRPTSMQSTTPRRDEPIRTELPSEQPTEEQQAPEDAPQDQAGDEGTDQQDQEQQDAPSLPGGQTVGQQDTPAEESQQDDQATAQADPTDSPETDQQPGTGATGLAQPQTAPAPAPTTSTPAGGSFLATLQNNMLYVIIGLALLIIIAVVLVVMMRRRSADNQAQAAGSSLAGPPPSQRRDMDQTVRDQPTGQPDVNTDVSDAQTSVQDEQTDMSDAQTGVADSPTAEPDEVTGQPDQDSFIADKPTMTDPTTGDDSTGGMAGESPTVELEDETMSDSQADDVQETTGGDSFAPTTPAEGHETPAPESPEDTGGIDISPSEEPEEETSGQQEEPDPFAAPPPPVEGESDADDDQTYNSLMFGGEGEDTENVAADGEGEDDNDQTFNSLMFGSGEDTGEDKPAEASSDQPKQEQDDRDATKPMPGVEPAPKEEKEKPPRKADTSTTGRANLFERQRDAGKAAMDEGDYGKAVQALSVAASLKPGDKDVRALLDEARKKRRGS